MSILKVYITRFIQIYPWGTRERCAFDLEDNPKLQSSRNAEERLGIPALRFDTIAERDKALDILQQYLAGRLVRRGEEDV